MRIVGFIKKNGFFFLGLIILGFVIFSNIFPKGYVFAGGDTAQLINAKESFLSHFYDWEGRVSLYYLIYFFLNSFGISDSSQLSWYLGIFIFGSYASFYVFLKLVFPKISGLGKMNLSLFYALNLYTLFVFSGNWGFSHFQSFYIFIPVLFGLYMRFLETKKNVFGALFSLALFFASPGFGNPAFALSFGIVIFFLTLFFFIFRAVKPKWELAIKILLIAVVSLLASAHWIFPIIPQMNAVVSGIFSGNAIDLNLWISHNSNPISRTLVLLNRSNDYFPDNFPYKSIVFLKDFFALLSFLPAIVIFYSLSKLKTFEKRNKRYFFVFSSILILLILLTAKVRPPFETINFHIFNAWGLNTLRSWEKCSIYVPFVFGVLLSVFLIEFKNKKWAYALFVIILLIPLPFYVGKLQQNMSYRFSNARPENKDFKKSKLSFLVKIPEEYYKIRSAINNNKEKFFLAKLPYGSNDGSGISNYPKWKFYGVDVTNFLYNKKTIESNATYFGKWNPAEEFGNQKPGESYDWIIEILGMENAKYVIFHKDNPEGSVKDTQYKMDQLEKEELIKKKNDNQYFTLYEINSKYVVPYISWQDDSARVIQNPEAIKRSTDETFRKSIMAEFREINPKKFSVDVLVGQESKNLIIAEAYNSNWKAYTLDGSGKEIKIKGHFLARGYANGWKIPENSGAKKVIIEYYPIRLMWRGIAISAITALFLILYLIKYYYVNKKDKKCNL